MSGVVATPMQAPCTYQEWLSCFEKMRHPDGACSEAFDAARRGSFVGSERTRNALQQQIIETVNVLLDKSTKRFTRKLNGCLAFGDFLSVELLFKRLKTDTNCCLFFTELTFLPGEFLVQLEEEIRTKMDAFWGDCIRVLREMCLESLNDEMEDCLFLVRRIRLFQ